MTKPRGLRIFARYEQFGGEEAVARKIHEDLMPWMDADWFEGSTDELLGNRHIDRLAAPLKVIHHEAAAHRFRELIEQARYDALEIHNVLPALSPAIYAAAFDSGNWGALPETVADAGLIVQVEREGELAAAMRTLLEDHELTEGLAARGRDKLRSQFNREFWLERIRAVYQSCGVTIDR